MRLNPSIYTVPNLTIGKRTLLSDFIKTYRNYEYARISVCVDDSLLLSVSKILSRGWGLIAVALDECPALSDLLSPRYFQNSRLGYTLPWPWLELRNSGPSSIEIDSSVHNIDLGLWHIYSTYSHMFEYSLWAMQFCSVITFFVLSGSCSVCARQSAL